MPGGGSEIQVDYVLSFGALAMVVLSVVLLTLHQRKVGKLPWGLLGLFAITHGFNRWLELLAMSLADGPAFKTARTC